jgi:hypothetical protein
MRWAGRAIAAWAKPRSDLIVENLCLRQQLLTSKAPAGPPDGVLAKDKVPAEKQRQALGVDLVVLQGGQCTYGITTGASS